MSATLLSILQKYDVPVPRYTSYPTVPYWDASTINENVWKQSVIRRFETENGGIPLI